MGLSIYYIYVFFFSPSPRFVFRKIRALLGGKLRLVASGGAPLSPDTHDFVRATLGVPVLQVSWNSFPTVCNVFNLFMPRFICTG